MTDAASKALLPIGLHDTLAPMAEREASVVSTLLNSFYSFGYGQIAAPLAEFEETLLSSVGASEGRRMFRLMDPASRQMLGIRTDITTQIARIATTRLAEAARPLRLCYAGQVLRVEGDQLRREREVCQAGVELVGEAATTADLEVLSLAIQSVRAAGIDGFTVDLTLPQFVPQLCDSLGVDAETTARIREALDSKDIDTLNALEGDAGALFKALLSAACPADIALERLAGLDLPAAIASQIDGMAAFVAALREQHSKVTLTIDLGEYRNFEYHEGLCFTLFAPDGDGELARGGRYSVSGEDGDAETAVGFTVYVDAVMRARAEDDVPNCVFVPLEEAAQAATLRAEGWRVVTGLTAAADAAQEAKRMGCTHVYDAGQINEL
jgi:ATP phosphoribosyltransferase regulatory subunit